MVTKIKSQGLHDNFNKRMNPRAGYRRSFESHNETHDG